jgi:hypothetical protein
MIERIISGGQTGVDRAALDIALELGIACGGWCPRGRRAEDGAIDRRYPLTETPREEYPQRTQWNVRDADGTLVMTRGPARGGTGLTISIAKRLGKPLLVVDFTQEQDAAKVRTWAEGNGVSVLNVAGPREGENPGIYDEAVRFLRAVLGSS